MAAATVLVAAGGLVHVAGTRARIAIADARIAGLTAERDAGYGAAGIEDGPCGFDRSLGPVPYTLPFEPEIAPLVFSVSQVARASGVELLEVEPLPEVWHEGYGEVPLRVVLEGEFGALASFGDRLTRLHRIVDVADLSMEKTGEGRSLRATARVRTYRWLPEEPAA